MPFKIFAGVLAVLVMVTYLVPPVLKLKDVALGVIVALGLGMMLVDLWQSIRKDD